MLNSRTSVSSSVFARLLRVLAQAVCRYPKWFIYPHFVIFAICVYYTAFSSFHLKMDMDRDNLVGSDKSYHQAFMKYRAEFPGEDELAVVVESGDQERNRQFVERLGAKLEHETNLFTDVFYKGDLRALGPKALLFVPETNLVELRDKLVDYQPFIKKFTAATNLDSLFGLINEQFRTAKREENKDNESLIGAIPALQRILAQASACLEQSGTPVSPGVTALFGAGEEADRDMYITFAKGRLYLVTARARTQDATADAVVRMRQLMAETKLEVPGINVGLTGEPALDYDEERQSEHDAIMATIVSLVVCSLIFIYAYQGTGRPLKTVACLVIGLGYTMGFTTLVIGHLNILTITFAPILIGLAIDFGIHFITRYEEEIRHHRSPAEAVDKAMVFTGQGIITGALTTAAAFLAMGLTDFKGIQEMGIISGGGLVLCLIPMMTMLPVLLMRGRQNIMDPRTAAAEKRARIEDIWLQRPAWVIGLTVALCGLAALCFGKVFFDYNLLHMQSKGLPSVEYEGKLLHSGQSVLFAALQADTPEQARQFELTVEKLPAVARADRDEEKGEAIFAMLTQDQTAKLKLVRDIEAKLAEVPPFAPIDPYQVRMADSDSTNRELPNLAATQESAVAAAHLTELATTLWRTSGYLLFAVDETKKDKPELAAQLRTLYDTIVAFRVKVLQGDPEIPVRLSKFQLALFNDIRSTFDSIRNQDVSGPLRPQDLPPSLHSRFIGVTGKYRVLVFPKGDIWERKDQAEFINELRSKIPPDRVTGTPVQLYEYETLLKDSYVQAARYALAAIAVMVLLHFRSLLCVALALLPVAIGTIWMGGLMGAIGIPFNPANIMTLPLVIGIGVTNGIHILNRFAEEQNPGILAKSTGKAVLVSGLTAMTGFGSLILGKHQGIQSLGLVMSMGIATCMIAGLTFLPALLNILVRRGWTVQIKRPSNDNARPPLGPEEPR